MSVFLLQEPAGGAPIGTSLGWLAAASKLRPSRAPFFLSIPYPAFYCDRAKSIEETHLKSSFLSCSLPVFSKWGYDKAWIGCWGWSRDVERVLKRGLGMLQGCAKKDLGMLQE